MSEVLILLKLRRRSGILAAAVAAVHKTGLTFQSQQAREVEGVPGLLLKAEGSTVPEYADLVSHLESVKGVDRVAEIQVDGQTLLPQSAEPEDDSDEGGTDDGPEIEVNAAATPDRRQALPPQAPPTVEDQAVKEPDSDLDTAPKREMTRTVKRRWRRYR